MIKEMLLGWNSSTESRRDFVFWGHMALNPFAYKSKITKPEVSMEIIDYHIKPVISRQKFASNAGKGHQPRHLEDKAPEVINSIDQTMSQKSTHQFVFK